MIGGVLGGTIGGTLGTDGEGPPRDSLVIKCVRRADGELDACRVTRSVPHLDALVLEGVQRLRLPRTDDDWGRVDLVVPLRLVLPHRYAWQTR